MKNSVDCMNNKDLNSYINTLEILKKDISEDLIKINKKFRIVDEELKEALEIREVRIVTKIRSD